MIQAFLDDSGVKGTDKVFTFGGFLGRAEVWAQLSDEWREWLKDVPSIKYFKMKEAANRDGQFRGFTKGERDAKLKGGLVILRKHPPQKAIHVSVSISEYEQQVAQRTPRSLRNPYFLAFFGIISGCCYEVVDSKTGEKIELIFDEHSIFQPRINRWYPYARRNVESVESVVRTNGSLKDVLPPSPIFKSDTDFLPLQAADIIAWLFRNYLSEDDDEFDWVAGELKEFVSLSRYSTYYAGKRLERYVRSIERAAAQFPEEMAADFDEVLGMDMVLDEREKAKRLRTREFDRFDSAMRKLMKVSHDDIKAALDAEKQAKKEKQKSKTSASDRASREQD